jgi:delta 1-pyrroline-5-carboxylate dehydrogenase
MTSKKHRSFVWVHILVAVSIICWIGVKTQATANRQEKADRETIAFASQTRDCLHELLDVLAVRNQINAEEDELLQQKDDVIAKMVAEMSTTEMGHEHKVREWARVRDKYASQIVAIQERRARIVEARNSHPLPSSPSCPPEGETSP